MRFPPAAALAALLAACSSAPAAPPAPGTYFLWFAPSPSVQERVAIVKVDAGSVTLVKAGPDRPKVVFGKPTTEAGRLRFPVTLGKLDLTFDCAADPADPARVLGAFADNDGAFRGGLTRTDKAAFAPEDGEVTAPLPPAVTAADKLFAAAREARGKAAREKDPAQAQKLGAEAEAAAKAALAAAGAAYRDAIKGADPTAAIDAAEGLLGRAAALAVTPAEAAACLAILEADAKRYGPRFEAVAAVRLAAAVSESEALAPVALAASKKASTFPGVSLKGRAEALTLLAAAQAKAGQAAEAAATRGELAKIDIALDDEYRRTVPPFKPEAYPGRKNKAADRVAVVELFTGAQCPPCVAADAAFDGLLARYAAKDVILLQYHVHSPGPDALTNPDTAARFDYYGARHGEAFAGTPAAAVGGKSTPRPGGSLAEAKETFREFVARIDTELEESSPVKLAGKAELAGDTLTVSVEAGVKESKDSVKLRLLLVENEVKYVGPNGVRLHRHVVRGTFGTGAGLPVVGLKDGKHTATASLKDLRAALGKYLEEYEANEGSFPTADRPLALAGLKVFALVQDDATGEILQGAELPVTGK